MGCEQEGIGVSRADAVGLQPYNVPGRDDGRLRLGSFERSTLGERKLRSYVVVVVVVLSQSVRIGPPPESQGGGRTVDDFGRYALEEQRGALVNHTM